MSPITRRSLIQACAAAPLAAALSQHRAFAAAPADFAGQTLRVATYGGSWRDAIVQSIIPDLVSHGLKVDFTLGMPDDNLARLIAAKRQSQVPFDVIDPSPLFYNDAVKAGFFAAVDYDRLPNARFIPDWAHDERQVVVLWTTDAIVYNAEKYAALGIAPPQLYSDLGNPKLRGHVAFPDPGHVQHWAAVVGLAYESGGDEANLAGAIDRVNEINPAYFFNSSIELASKMSSGDIWAAPWHGGWAVRLKRSGVPAAAAYAKFGDRKGALYPSAHAVISGTPNGDAAHAYIDAWLTVDGPAKMCDATGSVPVNPQARAKMAEDSDNRAMLLLTDDALANAYHLKWDLINEKAWRDQWNRGIHR